MSVYLAHGKNEEEVKKYKFIDEWEGFSIAEYFYEEGKEAMYPFRHSHDEYEFIIPLNTIPILRYGKANYIGEVGFCYPVNPYVDHGIEFDLNSHVISITVEKDIVESHKEALGFKDKYFYTRFIEGKELCISIAKFQEEARKKIPNKMILDLIKRNILETLVKDGLSSGVDNRRPEKIYAKNIKMVLVYMFENYHNKDLSIPRLAEIGGYSVAYFSRAFKSFMGDPPIVHLNKLRLSEAKELFNDKTLSLGEIASRVGFKNLSTFSESFKNIIGMTPKKYRDRYCS